MKAKSTIQNIVFIALLLLAPAAWAQFTFTTNNGAITVTGYSGSGNVTIPSSTNGYPVTTIATSAFYNNTAVTSVTIPNSVTNIGGWAFWECYGLTNVTIGNGVISIGNSAFEYCSALTSVTIPNSVTSIGYSVFENCSALHLAYFLGNPPSVNYGMNNTVFDGESGTVYYLPNTTGWGATFGGWPTAVYSPPATNFVYITNNGAITITGYVGAGGGVFGVVIPGSINGYPVTTIGTNAFMDEISLTNVTIPNSVTNIGDYAFEYCSGLTSVTIPNSVTNLGNYVFAYCFNLTNVTIPNSVTNLGNYVFGYCSNLTSVTIPNSVTNLGNYAFAYCSGLTRVTIPNSVTCIGNYAFEYCSGLQQAYFLGNAPSVNGGAGSADSTAFAGESGTAYYLPGTTGWGATFGGWPTAANTPVTNFVYITNSGAITITSYVGAGGNVGIPISINGYPVTTIGASAFNNKAGVTGVSIPNCVTNIGDGAFYACTGLTNITISTNVTSIGKDLFYACNDMTSVMIPGSVTNIGDYAFAGSGLTSIIIPSSVTSIGLEAFYGCSLTNVTIPSSVTNIGDYAFAGSGLTSVIIPNSVTSIGNSVFNGCANLASAVILTNATSIGNSTFQNCTSLINVTIPNSVTNIGYNAFYYCTSLVNITIPNSVISIGDEAFFDCYSLTNITVNAANPSYTSAGGVLFDKTMATLIQCPAGLTGSYVISNSVTSIGTEAFDSCFGLTNVTIPNSVTSIGNYAFGVCSGLSNVTIPKNVTNLGSYVFEFCSGLHQAYFLGNAPTVNGGTGSADNTVFKYSAAGAVFFLPGTTGWSTTFGGWPTAFWYQPRPQILGSGYGLSVRTNGFQFTISWATNTTVAVLTSTNLQNWTPIITNTLVSGTNLFRDSNWINYPQRFYRVRSP